MSMVHFIGAGPGDAELITVKGARLLSIRPARSLSRYEGFSQSQSQIHASLCPNLPGYPNWAAVCCPIAVVPTTTDNHYALLM
jgi:hypothetical protein